MTEQRPTRSVAWGREYVPAERPHVYGIVSPRPHESHVVGVILGKRWLKIFDHFRLVPGQSRKGYPEPHWEPASACAGCYELGQTPRGKYVVPVYFHGNNRVKVLEVCGKTHEFCAQLIDPDFDWTHMLVRAFRNGEGRKSRTGLEITRKATGEYPECPPITPTLENLWRLAPGTLPQEWNLEIRGEVAA
jgi:hypothetical protein